MPVSDRLARIVAAHWFTTTILAVIVVNAVVLGLDVPGGRRPVRGRRSASSTTSAS